MAISNPKIPSPNTAAPEMPNHEKLPAFKEAAKPEGSGVPQSYKDSAHSGANVMWRAKIKGQKQLSENIPFHVSLKTFDKPGEVPIDEIHQKVKELGIQRPDPKKLTVKPEIFHSPRTGQSYYMLKLHGTDPSYAKFNQHFAGRGITHENAPNGFMGHITVNKDIFDKVQKEGIKPEELEFSPLMIEHGANNPTHLFPDNESHKDVSDDVTPKKLNPMAIKKAEEFLSKPYSSEAQRRWAHTQTGKEALGGDAAVHEWDEATKGKKLPEKVKKTEEDPSNSKANDEDVKPLMNRIEDKYFVHRDQLDRLKSKLKEKLKEGDIDTNTRYNLNQTIYLDSQDLICFRANMENKKPRIKVRIRRYAPNGTKWEDVAYAELKIKKEDGMSDKVRIRIPADIIRSIASGIPIVEKGQLVELNKDIAKEELSKRINKFNQVVENHRLHKSMVVVYERRAYSGKDLRITVDDMLKCAPLSVLPEDIKKDLESGEYKKFVKPLRKFNENDYLIVEVKHMNDLPNWVDELLKEVDAKNVKFSKYCASVYSCLGISKETKRSTKLFDFQEDKEMNKSESFLAKGIASKLGTAAAMMGALSGAPNIAHAPKQPIPQVQPGAYSSNRMLNAIAQVESSGGKNVQHAPVPGKMHNNESAYGKYGLMPETIRETIKTDPNLSKLHAKAANLHGQDMAHYMEDNAGLEQGIAERYLHRLEHHFGQDPAKIGLGWLDGVHGASKKLKQGLDPKTHWHAKKVLDAYQQGK